MEYLDNIRIGRKLIGSFLIIVALLAIVAIGGYLGIQAGTEGIDKTYNLYLIGMQHLGDAKSSLLTMRGDVFGYIAYPGERNEYQKNIQASEGSFKTALSTYESIKTDSVKKEKAKKVQENFDAYTASVKKLFALVDKNEMESVEKMTIKGGETALARQVVVDGINELRTMEIDDGSEYYQKTSSTGQTSTFLIAVISIIAILFSLVLAVILTRSITLPIGQVKNILSEMKLGHLSTRLQLTRKDELGDMARTMDEFANDLQHSVIQIIHMIADGERVHMPEVKDREDEIGPAIQTLVTTLRNLTDETTKLITAAKSGDLSARGDASQFKGRFQEIVCGINETLEAMVTPVEEAIHLSKKYAAGDFSVRFNSKLNVSGDFIDFKDALNHVGEELSEAVGSVKHEVETISSGMEETASSVREVAESVTLLTENATNVSGLAEKSGDGIQQTLTAMEDLSTTVGSVAGKAETASGLAQKTVDLSSSGMELAEKAEKGMDGIMQSFAGTESMVNDITSQMDEIGRIVDVITGISEQTGLLALNAAIEAARAGDAGMGFAVVADEVKSLALESQKSAENIASIIGNLQKKSQMVSDSMKTSSAEVKIGNEAVGKTLQVFDQIVQAINEVYRNMTEVAGATEEQAAAVQEITASITELDNMVKQTAKEAVNSAAATEQVAASVDQINRVVSDAATALQKISTDMGKFTV